MAKGLNHKETIEAMKLLDKMNDLQMLWALRRVLQHAGHHKMKHLISFAYEMAGWKESIEATEREYKKTLTCPEGTESITFSTHGDPKEFSINYKI